MWPGAAFVDEGDERSSGLEAYVSVSYAFEHFYHMDRANACIHEAPVRYSPITFGLSAILYNLGSRSSEVEQVEGARGKYELDKGR